MKKVLFAILISLLQTGCYGYKYVYVAVPSCSKPLIEPEPTYLLSNYEGKLLSDPNSPVDPNIVRLYSGSLDQCRAHVKNQRLMLEQYEHEHKQGLIFGEQLMKVHEELEKQK